MSTVCLDLPVARRYAEDMIKPLLLGLSYALLLAGCSTNLCARKDAVLSNKCVGGDVTYTRDTSCESKIKNCSEGQLAQFEGYVSCLEKANQCSLDIMAACGAQYPGGVNLFCGGG